MGQICKRGFEGLSGLPRHFPSSSCASFEAQPERVDVDIEPSTGSGRFALGWDTRGGPSQRCLRPDPVFFLVSVRCAEKNKLSEGPLPGGRSRCPSGASALRSGPLVLGIRLSSWSRVSLDLSGAERPVGPSSLPDGVETVRQPHDGGVSLAHSRFIASLMEDWRPGGVLRHAVASSFLEVCLASALRKLSSPGNPGDLPPSGFPGRCELGHPSEALQQLEAAVIAAGSPRCSMTLGSFRVAEYVRQAWTGKSGEAGERRLKTPAGSLVSSSKVSSSRTVRVVTGGGPRQQGGEVLRRAPLLLRPSRSAPPVVVWKRGVLIPAQPSPHHRRGGFCLPHQNLGRPAVPAASPARRPSVTTRSAHQPLPIHSPGGLRSFSQSLASRRPLQVGEGVPRALGAGERDAVVADDVGQVGVLRTAPGRPPRHGLLAGAAVKRSSRGPVVAASPSHLSPIAGRPPAGPHLLSQLSSQRQACDAGGKGGSPAVPGVLNCSFRRRPRVASALEFTPPSGRGAAGGSVRQCAVSRAGAGRASGALVLLPLGF